MAAGRESSADGTLLTERHLRQWQTVFEHLTGLQLTAERKAVVANVLQERIDRLTCPSADHYLALLQGASSLSREEWDLLIARVVIGETRFFRYGSSFAFTARFLAERLAAGGAAGKLTAWSLGCSTGEEAYSLAMVMHRLGGDGSVPYSVVGTDINGASLRQASRGIYRNILGRGVDEVTATTCFQRLDDGCYQVSPDIRSRVAFLRHNMLEPVTSALIPPMDLISCQNVLMYFQPWRRRAVIRQLVPCLKVGGVLLLCPGDLVNWKPDSLERLPDGDVQAYRRRY